MDDDVTRQRNDKSEEVWEAKPPWWWWKRQERGERWRNREGVWLHFAVAVRYVSLAVMGLCIERALPGHLLTPLSTQSGQVERYYRKQGWVTFRKRDRERRMKGERMKRTTSQFVLFSNFTSQIFTKTPGASLNVTLWNRISAFNFWIPLQLLKSITNCNVASKLAADSFICDNSMTMFKTEK